MKNANMPAIPTKAKLSRDESEVRCFQIANDAVFQFEGLTKREYFACEAMKVIMADFGWAEHCRGIVQDADMENDIQYIVGASYEMADMMLDGSK